MGRPKISKVIPEDVRNYLTSAYKNKISNNNDSPAKGKTGRYRAFTKALNEYLIQKADTNDKLADIAEYFGIKGIGEETIFSAFSLKGRGKNQDGRERDAASKYTRDLLCLFASNGHFDWDKTLTKLFPDHLDQLDSSARQLLEGIDKKALPSSTERDFVRTTFIEADVPKLNNPDYPVFPPAPWFTPAWPATPTFPIQVPGFLDVYLKDESANPTGLHKDRMAWEIAKKAKYFEDQHGHGRDFSLITSGGAAISIQFFLNLIGASSTLRAVVHPGMDDALKEAMVKLGCLVFEADLKAKELTQADIRQATDNKNVIDLTYRTTDIPGIEYYDWLSCEILNSEPDYCFIPFGTGELYTNVLRFVQKAYHERFFQCDLRLKANIDRLTKCHFLGATTDRADSKLTKLFAYHRPLYENHKGLVKKLRSDEIIGSSSSIEVVRERYVDEAIDIAATLGINCEPSGIAGLALLLQMKKKVNVSAKILIVNTGRTNLHPLPPSSKKSNKS
ncbi:MAG: PLP-dependent lyase/thiolase [Chloracidobacterium sp.]|nr:PLP-dependent lyase/thiolase [Chloracidobacterium sp.]